MAILTEAQSIRDTYEVERFLGEGAFAEVFRVKHRFLGRQAMKVFKAAGMTLLDIEDALGEAIMLSRIGHPNIVRVFDANVVQTPKGLFGFFTMENVAGGSLDKFWQSHGTEFVPIETTIDLMKQVCRGLSVAHREQPPIVHRDIKPQNILVGYETDGLRARVSDFGLHTPAKLFDADPEGAKALAQQRAIASLNEYLLDPIESVLAPCRDGSLAIEVKSPLDLEKDISLPRGNIFHRDLDFPFLESVAGDQQLWGAETDDPHIYLAGAGALRGGGVSGIAGHNAAMALLAKV